MYTAPPCRFEQSSIGCRFGTNCRFLHIGNFTETSPPPGPPRVDTKELMGPFFAIDVECVATGLGYK